MYFSAVLLSASLGHALFIFQVQLIVRILHISVIWKPQKIFGKLSVYLKISYWVGLMFGLLPPSVLFYRDNVLKICHFHIDCWCLRVTTAELSDLSVSYMGEHLCCPAELRSHALNLLNDIHGDSFSSVPSSSILLTVFQVMSVGEGKYLQSLNHNIWSSQIFRVNLLLAFSFQ